VSLPQEKEEAKALLREIHSTQQAYTADTSLNSSLEDLGGEDPNDE
jgi:hypothetical protein